MIKSTVRDDQFIRNIQLFADLHTESAGHVGLPAPGGMLASGDFNHSESD